MAKALKEGFRKFDTAEADWWYDQQAVGQSLEKFWLDLEDLTDRQEFCSSLKVSTKIPPWSLTSEDDIRRHAMESRQELVGFCDGINDSGSSSSTTKKPLDIYYIHAPRCWPGWHPRCQDPPPTLELREAWMAMEAVVSGSGQDDSAQRIGLSNVHPPELLDLIEWTHGRLVEYEQHQEEEQSREGEDQAALSRRPRPRIPDVLQIYADPINPASEIRRICSEWGIEFVSYSTLGTQHRGTTDNPVLSSPVVQSLAMKHQRSTAEVVLSWALQQDMSVIPRSSKPEHIEELARLLDPSSSQFLHPEDMDLMDTLDKDYVGEL